MLFRFWQVACLGKRRQVDACVCSPGFSPTCPQVELGVYRLYTAHGDRKMFANGSIFWPSPSTPVQRFLCHMCTSMLLKPSISV